MRKELVAYRKRIDAVIASPDELFYDDIVEDHLVQIAFFQHERLVHLHVTLGFAIMEIMTLIALALFPSPAFLALAVLFLAGLVPYVVHYVFLENETQKLYPQYEALQRIARRKKNRTEREIMFNRQLAEARKVPKQDTKKR